MVVLESIAIINKRRIEYKYSCDVNSQKYFNKNDSFFVEYEEDISEVPQSILVIPFLANFCPISWFAGFDIKISDVDQTFSDSLKDLKDVFEKYFPGILGKSSNLIFDNTINNRFEDGKDCMLFSGGVDAYATYFRNNNNLLDLITIRGADISLEDDVQWNDVVEYNTTEKLIKGNLKCFIKSNLRTFSTFEVDKLLPHLGWWGKVQHGMALTCLVAPLAFKNKYENIYIASSYTRRPDYKFIIWGSMPEIDNLIKWSSSRVVHDGELLTRQDKIKVIHEAVDLSDNNLSLRVCYSDYKIGLNCSVCEKCLRTIFGLLISGGNPNNYGFVVDDTIYFRIKSLLSRDFRSEGGQLFWKEMLVYALENDSYFYFKNQEIESQKYVEIIKLLETRCYSEIENMSNSTKFKLGIISKFPKSFKLYLKLRRKLL